MKTLYLDLFSGISGDMFVGALIDLGVDPAELERQLGLLQLPGYHLHIGRKQNGGLEGIKFDVHLESEPAPHSHPAHSPGHHHQAADEPHSHAHPHSPAPESHRDFAQIRQLISSSSLSPWVSEKAVAVFERIARAEGAIHGRPPDQVHFHEVGAVDSIVDIVAACIGLELLGRPRVLAGPVVDGSGWVDCAHGRLPVPAPATLAILAARKIPLTQCEERSELITPTGAALLAEFAESFGPMIDFAPHRIGFGLGARQNQTRPNVLRAILGESGARSAGTDWETDTITVLETNLDDSQPEILGGFLARALAAGALDVFHPPIQMKKNRPGVLLTVLCAAADADRFCEMILRETTAFGVRRHEAQRRKLRREFASVNTPFGEITVKLGRLNGQVVQAAPEFDSCQAAAERAGVPLPQIYRAAQTACSS